MLIPKKHLPILTNTVIEYSQLFYMASVNKLPSRMMELYRDGEEQFASDMAKRTLKVMGYKGTFQEIDDFLEEMEPTAYRILRQIGLQLKNDLKRTL